MKFDGNRWSLQSRLFKSINNITLARLNEFRRSKKCAAFSAVPRTPVAMADGIGNRCNTIWIYSRCIGTMNVAFLASLSVLVCLA